MSQCTVRKIPDLESLQIEQVRQWLFKIGEPEEDHDLQIRHDEDLIFIVPHQSDVHG